MKKVPSNKKYIPEITPSSFLEAAKQGISVIEIAREWEMSTETIYNWVRVYPEFAQAYQDAKQYLKRKPKHLRIST